MEKCKKTMKNLPEGIDWGLEFGPRKRPRGRPKGVHMREVVNRASHYAAVLKHSWDVLGQALADGSKDEILTALERIDGNNRQDLTQLIPVILQVRKERTFPTRPKAQIRFFAESLAARGIVSPRRSRDICGEFRRMEEKQHTIIRQDYYIECTCGYQGPAHRGTCPACKTSIVSPTASSPIFDFFG